MNQTNDATDAIDLTKPFQLGGWRVDPAVGQATSGDDVVKIDPRNMRVLQILVERRGQLVSLREIRTLAWDSAIVTTDSLYQSIRQLRQAFRDTKSPPQYIQTLPRRGYRLIAPVTALRQSRAAESPDAAESAAPPTMSAPVDLPIITQTGAPRGRNRAVYLGVGTSVLVVLSLGLVLHPNLWPASARPSGYALGRAPTTVDRAQSVQDLRDRASMALNEGRPREALQDFQQALDVQLGKTGEDSEIVVKILVDLARTQMWLDDQASAFRTANRAIAIFDRLSAKSNPDLIATYSVAAEVFLGVGEYTAAERLVSASLALAEQLYGENHVATSEPRGLRAILSFAQQDLPAAERAARKTVETLARARGEEDFRTAHWHAILGAVLTDQGKFAEAELEARLATDVLGRIVDKRHPYLLSAKHVLADVLVRQRRHLQEAEALATEVREELTAARAAPWRIARTEGVLGEALFWQGKAAGAERHLLLAKRHFAFAKGWPLDRELRDLQARMRLLSERRAPATSVASL